MNVEKEENECSICLQNISAENDMKQGGEGASLECLHTFHWDCIQSARKHGHCFCPICRHPIAFVVHHESRPPAGGEAGEGVSAGERVGSGEGASGSVVAVLMVRNEESLIHRTLKPFVDGGIESFMVLDAGSTDNTVAVTEQFFRDHPSLNGIVERQPFVDFSTSLNHLISAAESRFPNAVFLLMTDVDREIHNVEGLLDFCSRKEVSASHDSHAIQVIGPHYQYYSLTLIRCRQGAHFVGHLHEHLVGVSRGQHVPPDVFFMEKR